VIVSGLLVAGGLFSYTFARRHATPVAATETDPRLSYATPFRNVRPEVKYVGDAACAECHIEQAEAYRRHPMGRSFAPIAQAAANDRYDQAAGNPFEANGYRFEVEHRGRQVFHREIHTEAGRQPTTLEAEVHYVVGSGEHGKSYLVNRDGLLFQSPISWLTAQRTWAISPGFAENRHFERPVAVKCLFCHCNDANAVESAINRYREPVFQSFAIGCERCHGPGELHVVARQSGAPVATVDDTIVNPMHLEPAAREAVCQQCHLQGEQRVLRRGRHPFDYRPGLPLHLFWSVFVPTPGLGGSHKAVGQVEEMYASRCFQASQGKMGCISCHDPHVLPAENKKVAHYRERCLRCHSEESCRLALEVRRNQNADDNCVACHMPRRATADIAHTALTDHRIRRRPAETTSRPSRPWTGELPMVSFHRDLIDANDPDLSRDLGVALIDVLAENQLVIPPVGRMALPLLKKAVQRWPDDLAAREALGGALALLGRTSEGLEACEQILAQCPDRERTLLNAALFAEDLARREEALDYSRRVLALNPWSSNYRYQVAKLLRAREDWTGAAAECRELLRRNPHYRDARSLLTECLAHEGEDEQRRETAP
jgi:tetratricopeptide (TPR) repeat protein